MECTDDNHATVCPTSGTFNFFMIVVTESNLKCLPFFIANLCKNVWIMIS